MTFGIGFLYKLNRTLMCLCIQVGGNHIRVDRACPPRKKLKGDDVPLYDCKRTVFVGNLPFDVKVIF